MGFGCDYRPGRKRETSITGLEVVGGRVVLAPGGSTGDSGGGDGGQSVECPF